MSDDLEKLKGDIALAMGAIGVALGQTLVELDKRALKILQEKAKAQRAHMTTIGARDADLMLTTFVGALYDRRFFPQQPE
jgi:transposase